jgi:NAD(P)-dependent dehydrogenase (short-subunit alcohol dehydrogenase family)
MDLQLRGKRALITGSSSGIGTGIAQTLALEGVTVVVHGRDAGRCASVAERIAKSGGRCEVAVGDQFSPHRRPGRTDESGVAGHSLVRLAVDLRTERRRGLAHSPMLHDTWGGIRTTGPRSSAA